jgi:hypothetical protein
MKAPDAIKLFGLNNLSIESEIKKIEELHEVDLGHRPIKQQERDKIYYPQFSLKLRDESEAMAINYSIFYCLENSIRKLIADRLTEEFGPDWWNKPNVIPPNVVKNCDDNRKREIASGITPRSEDMIDYSNFGELGDIIRANWNHFGDMFRDQKALNRIFASLNTLRAPIAHCKALAEDEVMRLHLALRDWFRQMGS